MGPKSYRIWLNNAKLGLHVITVIKAENNTGATSASSYNESQLPHFFVVRPIIYLFNMKFVQQYTVKIR